MSVSALEEKESVTVKHIKLGSLDVSRIGLGAMGMSGVCTGHGTDDAESVRTVHRALDPGVTLIDTAEIYGPFVNEELVGGGGQGPAHQGAGDRRPYRRRRGPGRSRPVRAQGA